MSIDEQKNILRQEALAHRSRMDPRDEHPEEAVQLFFDGIEIDQGNVLAGYWPKGREFDVGYILDEAERRGIQCVLPVVEKDTRVLRFAQWSSQCEMVEGAFGILEPKDKSYLEPDILLIPLLAFDQRGGRLGYGGGYYDATLKYLRAKKDVLAIGAGYAQQACLFNLPREDHDELLDMIITPQGLKAFGK